MTRLGVTLLTASVAVVACAGPTSGPPQGGGKDRGSLIFPVQDPSNSVMQAFIEGKLISSGECLYVQPGTSHDTILPIWPNGFSYSEQAGRILVLDADGNAVAENGERVSMGGGLLGESDTPLPVELRPRVKGCAGPYWIVGEI